MSYISEPDEARKMECDLIYQGYFLHSLVFISLKHDGKKLNIWSREEFYFNGNFIFLTLLLDRTKC